METIKYPYTLLYWNAYLVYLQIFLSIDVLLRPVVAQGHKVLLYNRQVVGSIPTRGDGIFTYIYIFISLLWYSGKARCWVLPLNTPCLQNSAESGKWSVLTLGSLCLPCCVRDTAWSWYRYNFYKYFRQSVFIYLAANYWLARLFQFEEETSILSTIFDLT